MNNVVDVLQVFFFPVRFASCNEVDYISMLMIYILLVNEACGETSTN